MQHKADVRKATARKATARKAIVIGATGLVGQQLVKQLSAMYDNVIVIARRPPKYMSSNMHYYQVSDFANLADTFNNVMIDEHTDAFSCLGTTLRQAGSEEGFRLVDFNYNVSFATLCFNKGVRHFFLLSALGASTQSRFFYNRIKAETENAIAKLGFERFTVFRPSLLLGKHKGRPLERISQGLFKMVSPVVPESLPIHPISAKRVAMAIAMTAHAQYERSKFAEVLSSSHMQVIENKAMLTMTTVKR